MAKTNKYYRPAWGRYAAGFGPELPTMRKILTKLGVEWDEINMRGSTNDKDGVMIVMNEEEVKKLPIDDITLNKDTDRKPKGLYRHYLPTHIHEDGTYSGHSIYPVTLFQLSGLLKGAKTFNKKTLCALKK